MSKEKRKDKKEEASSASEKGAPQAAHDSKSEKQGGQHLDLEKLKNTTPTQAPKSQSSIADISARLGKKTSSVKGPKLDLKFTIFAAITVAFTALSTHIFGLNGGLVLNDRYNLSYVLNRELMGKISQNLMTDMLGAGPLMQPWLKASFIGDAGEYGLNFAWYHVANVFHHAAATAFLFFLVLTIARHLHHQSRLQVNPHHLAGASALLFAVHPLTCQAVTYLSARGALLGANNYFLSLDCLLLCLLIKHPFARACFALLALFTGAMSIWSNPECVTLPAVALLSILLIKGPLSKWQETVKDHPFMVGLTAAFSIVLPCLGLLGFHQTAAVNFFLPTLPAISYVASQFKAFAFYYLPNFLFPFMLSIDPPLTVAQGFSDPLVWAALAIIVGLVAVIRLKLKEPLIGFAGALLFLGVLPHACMIQRDTAADWVTYLPLAGVCIISAYLICRIALNRFQTSCIALISASIILMGFSIYRDWQWGSNMRLWQSALIFRPKSAMAHAMLSSEYLRRAEVDKADKEAEIAVKLGPELVVARLAEAKVLSAKGKYLEALAIYKSAQNLAETQFLEPAVKNECKLGQLECFIGLRSDKEGNELVSSLSQENLDTSKLIYLVGISAFMNQDYERAFKLLDRAVGSDPSLSEAFRPMAESALVLGAADAAVQAAQAYKNAFEDAYAQMLYARALIAAKRKDEAEKILKELISHEKQDARAFYLISRLYKLNGKTEEWKRYREDAIKLDPDISTKFLLPEMDRLEAESTQEAPADTAKPAEEKK